MLCNNYPLARETLIFLIFLSVLFSEACAGWMKDSRKADQYAIPGGLDTKDDSAKRDFLAGWEALELEKYDQAVFFFHQAANKDPEFPQVYYGLGLTCLKLKKYQEAKAYLDIAFTKGRDNRIFLQEVEKTRNDAITEASTVFQENARLAIKEQRYGEAILLLKKALIYKPDNPDLILLLVDALIGHQDYTEAIDGFTFFAEGYGETELKPYALLMLGKCYREKGETEEARRYFTAVENEYRGTEFSETASEELQSMGSN